MAHSVALGIHEHDEYRLGLRPPEPERPALRLASFLTGHVPDHPESVDYLEGVLFSLYANGRYGVCGPAALANQRRQVAAKLAPGLPPPTQEDVYDLYRRSGNPGFNPFTGADDKGVVLQAMLDQALKGGLGGVRPLGFARVATDDIEELQAAVALCGSLILGVDLEQAQKRQTDQGVWDWRPTFQWGGHAVLSGAYVSSPDDLDVITWAKRVKLTGAFLSHQLLEAWAVIWPEHVRDDAFLKGVDLSGFARAWEEITGRRFPAAVPVPEPAPVPAPAAGQLVIDPAARRISYPAGWTATPAVQAGLYGPGPSGTYGEGY